MFCVNKIEKKSLSKKSSANCPTPQISHLLNVHQPIVHRPVVRRSIVRAPWDLSHQDVEYFCTQWKKSIRKLFNLLYTTHCNLLSFICHDIPIKFQLISRAMKFLVKVGNSEIKALELCYRFALNGSISKISNTVNHVSCLLKESKHLLMQSSVQHKLIRCGNQIPENVMDKAGNICDLLLL